MAWVEMMGVNSVGYHEAVVLGRVDDFPGQTLAYYGSRGETPMVWGGSGAERLGLAGRVETDEYRALFADGGARDPILGTRLARTKRPGMELVISAHKSVAVLGVVGRADDMHRILDAETDATMAFLDAWTRKQGGRRGRLAIRTPTSGLVYGRTRHATSRAGDPNPHDHVLVANVIEMLDDVGGWIALDTAGVRDMVHAATAVGRLHAAWEAVQLGYALEPDDGPSGKLGHWRIAGVPNDACLTFSKRSEDIDDIVGPDASYQLRNRAARSTRPAKDDQAPEQLIDRWLDELEWLGHTPRSIVASLDQAARRHTAMEPLSDRELQALVDWVLSIDGPLSGDKCFGRPDLIRHLAPKLYGRHPEQLDRAVTAVLAHPESIPLIGQPGARNRAWVLAATLAVEHAVADCAERLASSLDGPTADRGAIEDAIVGQEPTIGASLTDGQRRLVETAARSGRRLELVLGVAGSGKTTALDALHSAYEASGFRVIGTATSGQAVQTLEEAAQVEARTTRSLLWRLASGTEHLDRDTVLVIDECGMVNDPTLLKLSVAAEAAGSKVIVVGDHHQLGAVGPGGGLEALIDRHPAAVHTLTENIRQVDPAERDALEDLRSGDVDRAVAWYADNDRIQPRADRTEALAAMCGAWLTDRFGGHDVAMLAWRRNDVAELNQIARRQLTRVGLLGRERVHTRDGHDYAVGDRVVALSPDPHGRYVTSQRGTVTAIDRLGPDGPTFTVAFDGGDEPVALRTTEIGADQLDHAYAVTVHRFQGATVDRTHLYANGGGRELAYVAASRARETTIIHCVADDVDQAVEDLARDWAVSRRQRWTLDTDVAAIDGQRLRPALAADGGPALRLGLLRVERDAVQAIMPPDPFAERSRLGIQSLHLRDQLRELRTGSGRYADTDLGAALRALSAAEAHLSQITRQLETAKLSRRERRKLEHAAEVGRSELTTARQAWRAIGADHELELVGQLDEVTTLIDELDSARHRPDPTRVAIQRRLDALDQQIAALEQQLGIDTHQMPGREPTTLGLSL